MAEAPEVAYGNADTGKLWTKSPDGTTSIPVCWIDPAATQANERRWVRDSVERTWEDHSLVTFTGWEACPASPNSFRGVRITIEDVADRAPHSRGVGTVIMSVNNEGPRLSGGMWLNFTYQNWTGCDRTIRDCIEMIAAHEFGHVLGFLHEHNRPEIENIMANNCQDRMEDNPVNGNITVGLWDLSSIMNYCGDWNNNGELSRVDIYMVKTAYGNVPRYHSKNKTACFPVVKSEGSKFHGCLRQVGSKWEAFNIIATSAESMEPATLSGSTLRIPFVYTYDGENVLGVYKDLTFQQDPDGLFRITTEAVSLLQ